MIPSVKAGGYDGTYDYTYTYFNGFANPPQWETMPCGAIFIVSDGQISITGCDSCHGSVQADGNTVWYRPDPVGGIETAKCTGKINSDGTGGGDWVASGYGKWSVTRVSGGQGGLLNPVTLFSTIFGLTLGIIGLGSSISKGVVATRGSGARGLGIKGKPRKRPPRGPKAPYRKGPRVPWTGTQSEVDVARGVWRSPLPWTATQPDTPPHYQTDAFGYPITTEGAQPLSGKGASIAPPRGFEGERDIDPGRQRVTITPNEVKPSITQFPDDYDVTVNSNWTNNLEYSLIKSSHEFTIVFKDGSLPSGPHPHIHYWINRGPVP